MLLLTAVVALTVAGCSHEAADWKSATLANTTEAYQSFLQQHPRSHQVAEARTRIQQLTEERDWQNAVTANTRDAYEQFMAQHPDSKWTQEAKMREENFAQADLNASTAAPPAPSTAGASAAAIAAAPSAVGASAAPPSSEPIATAPAPATHLGSKAPALRVAAAHATHSRIQWVQLGAFGSKSRAESHWKQLAARFAALKSLHPHYVAVRSHTHHVYRLQVRVASPAAASGLCATLKRHAQVCMRMHA